MLECGFYCSFGHYDIHIVIVLCCSCCMFTLPNLDCTLLRCCGSSVLRCWRLLNCVWSLCRTVGCVSAFGLHGLIHRRANGHSVENRVQGGQVCKERHSAFGGAQKGGAECRRYVCVEALLRRVC